MRIPRTGEIWNSRYRAFGFEKVILGVSGRYVEWRYDTLDTPNNTLLDIFIYDNEPIRLPEHLQFNDLIDLYYETNT